MQPDDPILAALKARASRPVGPTVDTAPSDPVLDALKARAARPAPAPTAPPAASPAPAERPGLLSRYAGALGSGVRAFADSPWETTKALGKAIGSGLAETGRDAARMLNPIPGAAGYNILADAGGDARQAALRIANVGATALPIAGRAAGAGLGAVMAADYAGAAGIGAASNPKDPGLGALLGLTANAVVDAPAAVKSVASLRGGMVPDLDGVTRGLAESAQPSVPALKERLRKPGTLYPDQSPGVYVDVLDEAGERMAQAQKAAKTAADRIARRTGRPAQSTFDDTPRRIPVSETVGAGAADDVIAAEIAAERAARTTADRAEPFSTTNPAIRRIPREEVELRQQAERAAAAQAEREAGQAAMDVGQQDLSRPIVEGAAPFSTKSDAVRRIPRDEVELRQQAARAAAAQGEREAAEATLETAAREGAANPNITREPAPGMIARANAAADYRRPFGSQIDESGYFDSMRTDVANSLRNPARVSTEGLVREYDALTTAMQGDAFDGLYRVAETDYGDAITVSTRSGRGPSRQAKALWRNEKRQGVLQRIEAELAKRGVQIADALAEYHGLADDATSVRPLEPFTMPDAALQPRASARPGAGVRRTTEAPVPPAPDTEVATALGNALERATNAPPPPRTPPVRPADAPPTAPAVTPDVTPAPVATSAPEPMPRVPDAVPEVPTPRAPEPTIEPTPTAAATPDAPVGGARVAPPEPAKTAEVNWQSYFAKEGPGGKTAERILADFVERNPEAVKAARGYEPQTVTRERAREGFKTMLSDPKTLDLQKVDALVARYGPSAEPALRMAAMENAEVIKQAAKILDDPASTPTMIAEAERVQFAAMQKADELAGLIISERSNWGRTGAALQMQLRMTADPDVWLVHAKRALGDKPLTMEIQTEVRRLAKLVADSCGI